MHRQMRWQKRLKQAFLKTRGERPSHDPQAARSLRSRPIELEQDELEQETPLQTGGGRRETRMQKRLKQASIRAESEEPEDEVADDSGADEDAEAAEVRGSNLRAAVLLCWRHG